MKYKKGLIFICLIICLVSIVGVSASELSNNVSDSVSVYNDNYDDLNYSLSESDNLLNYENDENMNLEENYPDGTFSDLISEIDNTDEELSLNKNYIYTSSDSDFREGILVNKSIIINGNGFLIDGSNNARAFNVLADNVQLKNFKFSNTLFVLGNAIHWKGNNGSLVNCTFNDISTDNVAIRSIDMRGGAIYWEGDNGYVANCTFNNCQLKSTINIDEMGSPISGYSYGGAVYWCGKNGILLNNKFYSCSSRILSSQNIAYNTKLQYYFNIFSRTYGGAVYWCGSNGSLIDNYFENCFSESTAKINNVQKYASGLRQMSDYKASAYSYGGAVYLSSNSKLINSTFKECYASSISNSNPSEVTETADVFISRSHSYGGALYWNGDEGYVTNCIFDDCYLKASSYSESYVSVRNSAYGSESDSSLYGSAVYLNGLCNVENSTFNGCSMKDYSYSYSYASVAPYISTSSLYGGAIYFDADNSVMHNCNFTDCYSLNSNFDDYNGGAVYWRGSYGSLNNCMFENCYANNGAGIYIFGSDGNYTNCCFNNCTALDRSVIFLFKFNEGKLVNCSFDGDEDSLENHVNSRYGVNPGFHVNITNNISEDYFIFGQDIIVEPYTERGATGNYSISVYYVGDGYVMQRGYAILPLSEKYTLKNLSAGNYEIYVTYLGNNFYSEKAITVDIALQKATPIIPMPILRNEGNIIIEVPFSEGVTGDVRLKINNNASIKSIINGSAAFNYDDLEVGDYEVLIEYLGDSNNNPNTIKYNVSIPLRNPKLFVFVNDTMYNEQVNVDYIINSSAKGIIEIYVNDDFVKNISIGDKIDLNYLKAGKNTIKLIYEGDDCFAASSISVCINIIGVDADYFIDYYLTAGDEGLIKFTFNNDTKGMIEIVFNDLSNVSFKSTLINGESFIQVPEFTAGDHDFNLTYSGDNKYYSFCSQDWIYVEYNDSPINIDIPKINWNDTVILNPNLPKGATGNITLLIDNITLANISAGNSYAYKAVKGGKHNLTVKYSGDDYFTENETTIEFYVNKLDSTFSIENTFDAAEYITIPITLVDDATGDITVNINDNIYSGKVINGTFNFTVHDLGAGTHTAVINYTNDDKYNDIYIAKEITVNLKKTDLNLDIHNILKNQDLLIRPTLTDGPTGTIDIYVDSAFETTINTDSSYTLQNLGVGQHKIKLAYSGSKYFESTQKEYSFRVFSLYPIETADTQIVFGTNKKFQAKFYDEYGEVLANKYVLFIVNNTEYPVKTNSEGIAVLDVDLAIGGYDVTSVSILDENTTNKLLIFHSVNAENMIMEYGSNAKFKATFLDENAKPLSNTNIIFNVDGKDIMVKTDINGVAVLNQELDIGKHTIISINTITDENMTNHALIVSDINSVVTLDIEDINYTQKAILNVNIGSGYLDANVEIKITGDNGYEQIFSQKASKSITKELSGLNAGKYFVDVKYTYSDDLLVIERNKTFTVGKINPEITITVDVNGGDATINVITSPSNATLTIKLNESLTYEDNLVNGYLSKTIYDLPVGEYTASVIFSGDNNYYPLIKSAKFTITNPWNFDVDFDSRVIVYDGEDCEIWIDVYNLAKSTNALLTLNIDDEVIKTQEYSYGYDEDTDEYFLTSQLSFDASKLSEDVHLWKINYYDEDNYINSTKSGLFNVYKIGSPDKQFLVTKNGTISEISGEFMFIKNGTIEDEDWPVRYTIYSFTADGVEYRAISWFPVTFYSTACYKIFNPNEFKEYDGIYYKTTNGKISEIIDTYEVIDGVYYENIGRPYDYYANGVDKNYILINGTCYRQQFYRLFDTKEGVDYNIINGSYYTLEGIKITEDPNWRWAIVNGAVYDVDGNYYYNHNAFSVGYDYLKVDNSFYRLLVSKALFEDEEGHSYSGINNTYALVNGQLFLVKDGILKSQVNIDVKETVYDVEIPSFKDISSGEFKTIKLPGDAGGTVTLTVKGTDYKFDVVNGVCKVELPELANGDYPYTITYSGDSKYSSFTDTGSLSINNKISTSITVPAVSTVYNGGKYLLITLKDVNGKPVSGVKVTVVLAGKTSTQTTDKNGQVKVSTNGLKPVNKYTATITFNGNANYDKSSTTAIVKVYKANPKFKYSAATFKKYDKKKKYTIRFLTNQNVAMKYAKVYIKVNKKVYAAKTNKKGFATFKLTKLTKKGKHTVNIIFKGDGYYNKLTKNVKIRVK